MTKTITEKPEQIEALEMAPEQKPFLEGDYFTGLCEIAAACHLKQELYTSTNNIGIFNSLYFKRIFARKTYGSKKDENYTAFITRVKDIIANKNFKLFSTTKVDKVDELDEILA